MYSEDTNWLIVCTNESQTNEFKINYGKPEETISIMAIIFLSVMQSISNMIQLYLIIGVSVS